MRVFPWFFIVLLSLAQPAVSSAGDDVFSPGAKAIGLGHSGVVAVYDASALYWNPAALAVKRSPQGFLSIHEPFTVNYLGYSHFVPKWGSYAVSISSTWRENNPIQGASIGWGYELMNGLSAGVHVNGFEQTERTWMTFGIGILFKPTRSIYQRPDPKNTRRSRYIEDRLEIGFVLYNVPVGQQYSNHQIRLGFSYEFLRSGPALIYAHHFSPEIDSDHLGLLFNPTTHVQIYAGLQNFDARQFSYGAGYEWDNINVHLAYDALAKSLIFSTSIRIGAHPKRIAENYYDQAIEALKQRDKKRARRQCEFSLLYDENNSKAHNLQNKLAIILDKENIKIDSLLIVAQSHQNQQNFLAAAAEYLKILKLDPRNNEAQEAIAMIRPKVNIDVERWYQQAVQAYNDGNIERAKELFDAIILVRPDHFGSKNYLVKIQSYYSKMAEQHYFAGLGYYSQRKLDSAEIEFEKALSIDPNIEDASDYLSRIKVERVQNNRQIAALLEEAGRFENNKMWARALSAYEEILKIQPDHSFALQRQRDVKSIIASNAERYYNQGKTAFDNGDYERALDLLNTVLSFDPSHAGARRLVNSISDSRQGHTRNYMGRAQEAVARKNWQEAIIFADSALTLNPSSQEAAALKVDAAKMLDVETLMRRAQSEYSNGRYLKAQDYLKAILVKNPDHAEAKKLQESCQVELNAQVDEMFNRGIQFYTEEKYREAINMWDNVLAINPYHKGALDYKERARERLDVLENLP